MLQTNAIWILSWYIYTHVVLVRVKFMLPGSDSYISRVQSSPKIKKRYKACNAYALIIRECNLVAIATHCHGTHSNKRTDEYEVIRANFQHYYVCISFGRLMTLFPRSCYGINLLGVPTVATELQKHSTGRISSSQKALTHIPLVSHICVSESGQHWFR